MKCLQEELHHISQYMMEEKLFKVVLSIQAGRSHAVQLKKSKKVHEASLNALRSSSNNPSRGQGEKGSSLIKKRRVNDTVGLPSDGEVSREVIRPLMIDIVTLNLDREIRPLKIPIPKEVLKHVCFGLQRAKEMALAAEKSTLEISNKELQDYLLEKEAAILDADAQPFTRNSGQSDSWNRRLTWISRAASVADDGLIISVVQ
ncbi:hypothetical protein IEQ34_013171 [Dendrobium chrysotoxum]|uniref:Uncharacterized protein n=1 Tax=Dendrobium chrysotoxum TaxID=161865 RepID=A0AAV7GMS7_DENCH|nr:hypothetical protein IEQ34_013171 [Dendrobium chrysotoxum]